MKANMSNADRGLRILAALIMVALYATNTVSGVIGTIVLLLAIVFALTSLVGFCPLYRLLGMKTKRTET